MNGLIALVGSGEYLPVMDGVDRFLLENCGAKGRLPRVICVPTAAGQEGEQSWGGWMRKGEQHFRHLGAQVTALPIIDRQSAENQQYADALLSADLIYFSGGNPHYLFETLTGSRAWQAAQKAWERGAVYAGCSAGAMILAGEIPNFRQAGMTSLPAFGLLPARMVFPHFDRWRLFRGVMLGPLKARLKNDEFVLGIDEDTALVGRLDQPEWAVMGSQTVSRMTKRETKVYRSGDLVPLRG